ncbi:MAG: carboxypeptidase regulatory-like domain-containing protein [Chloroflexales bacterium]
MAVDNSNLVQVATSTADTALPNQQAAHSGQASANPTTVTLPQIIAGSGGTCVINKNEVLHCWGINTYGQTSVPVDLGTISQVSMSGEHTDTDIGHTCAVTTTGSVRCWGGNQYGQATVPADLGLVSQVSAGYSHTCAVTTAGILRCWGSSLYSQTTVPTYLVGPITQVSTGDMYTCAIGAAGTLYCWGYSYFGTMYVPADLGSVTQVSVGRTHVCAVTTAGTLRCWGTSFNGETSVPTDIGSVSQISAGNGHTCAVTMIGTLRCWGDNGTGQINVPTDLGSVSYVSVGENHTCAVTTTGTLRCWGDNAYSQTAVPTDLGLVSQVNVGHGYNTCAVIKDSMLRCWGNNIYGQISAPTDLGPVSQVSAGFGHICAVTKDSTLRCWGNTTDTSIQMATVPPDLGLVRQVSAGSIHTCAVTTTGAVRCWGYNASGSTTVPADLGPVTQVSVGGSYTCAVTTIGTLRCWGENPGRWPPSVPEPTDLGPVTQVSVGGQICAVTTMGTLRCWGYNGTGAANVPSDLGSVSQVSAGNGYTCAVTTVGVLRCWGYNGAGGTSIPNNLGLVSQVSAGNGHTCAVTTVGVLRCWGYNTYGQATIPTDPLALPVTNCAQLIAIMNYPDGTIVNPGASFEKRWVLQNCGSAAWANGYQAVRISGDYGPTSFTVGGTAGTIVEVSATFTAPSIPGTYRATYKLQGPDGQFGDPFWVEVVVQQGTTSPIAGHVTDSSAHPLAEVSLSIRQGSAIIGTTITGSDGTYRFADLTTGIDYSVAALKTGYVFTPLTAFITPLTIDQGEVNFIGSVITYTISGRITNNNSLPLVGVSISNGTRTTTTDSSGVYTLSGVPPGAYTLTAMMRGYSFTPVIRSITVTGNLSGQDFIGTSATGSLVDVTISLYNNPTIAQRTAYESIIRSFADGVFEESNGAHKLRTVIIYTDKVLFDRAHIHWIRDCWPSAHLSGYVTEGLRVQMCDVFESGDFYQYDYLADEAHQRAGGYTLAHEWGHYYYSLYDEYRRDSSACIPDYPYWPCSDDSPVPNSIMDSQWNALGGDYTWLNFSTPLNNTQNTAQHRVYHASGWETLARPPALDPRDGVLKTYPTRLYYPELADVAPLPGQAPRIDLIARNSARSALQIIWAHSNVALAASQSDFTASLISLDGGQISYPTPIRVLATLQHDQAIAGAVAEGEVIAPDGSSKTVTLRDDGAAPDTRANDGLYSALLPYKQNGSYTIRVRFSNSAGTAREVADSGSLAPPPPGVNPQVPAPKPITDSFEVRTELTVQTVGVQADDHGDTPSTATTLAPNDTDMAGQIDRAGDHDFFRITTASAGTLVVRVTDLALGMQPEVRLLAADGKTELAHANLSTSASADYLLLKRTVAAGETLYVDVAHSDPVAEQGFYHISTGTLLSSEVAEAKTVYLPLIRR